MNYSDYILTVHACEIFYYDHEFCQLFLQKFNKCYSTPTDNLGPKNDYANFLSRGC